MFCALSYVVCFYALGQAMKLMTPGIAYAIWCGMGFDDVVWIYL
ncbi:SMR family transporter [Citrobacter freundii]